MTIRSLSMIKSMTGFGRGEAADESRKITVEMKSVNHRYFEPTIKMPKKLNVYEANIRTILKDFISRGKVDIFITYEDLKENQVNLKYNSELAEEYMKIFSAMAEQFTIENDIKVSSLARFPDVITAEEQQEDEEETWLVLEKALKAACTQFVESRVAEGEKLKTDLLAKLDGMLEVTAQIEAREPQLIAEYRQKLEDKVHELLADTMLDEGRIATEVTIFADKICVDEEMVRLKAHIQSMKDSLIEGGSVGRKLDFIAQEMNREANTTLSKANDLSTSNWGISLKTEIEKVREQIQNIE